MSDPLSPDVVVQLRLEICPPGVAVLYPGPQPVARLLLAPLGLAGAVCHESVRLISDPLRLCAGGVSPGSIESDYYLVRRWETRRTDESKDSPLVMVKVGLNPLLVCVRHSDGLY